MKLHALHRVGAVTQSHDQSVLCFRGDPQFSREGGALDDETVVTVGFKRSGQVVKYALSLVVDQRCFAVHRFGSAHDLTAVDLPDSLVSQAYAQCRDARPKGFDDSAGHTGLVGCAWAG